MSGIVLAVYIFCMWDISSLSWAVRGASKLPSLAVMNGAWEGCPQFPITLMPIVLQPQFSPQYSTAMYAVTSPT